MIGTVLDGRYRIVSKIGAGAMAVVYLADEVGESRPVAVKVLAAQPGDSRHQLGVRFEREFRSCSRLNHPNIIRLFGNGELPSGERWIAMEYLPHPSLDVVLDREGCLAPSRVLSIVEQAASALGHCHERGVIHRDVKPDNMVLAEGDRVILVDFGLVRDANVTALTATGMMIGTPYYMSPETIVGEGVDGRADLFGLAVVAFEALTARRPFEAPDISALLHKIVAGTRPRAGDLVAGLPSAWDDFFDSCLAPKAEDRVPDARAMLEALEPVRAAVEGRRPTPARRRPTTRPVRSARPGASATDPPSGAVEVIKPRLKASDQLSASAAGPRRLSRLAGPALALVLVLVGLLLALGGRGRSTVAWTVTDLTVTPGPGSVSVSWTSEVPYPSVVEVKDTPPRRVEGDGGQDVTSHHVTVGGLTEGMSVAVRVLLPSGERSLEKTAVAGTATIDDLSALAEPDGSTRLRWRAAWATEVRATVSSKGSVLEEAVARRGPDGLFELSLKLLDGTVDEVALTAERSGGSPVGLSLARILPDLVTKLSTRLATLDLPRLVGRVAQEGHPGVMAENERRRAAGTPMTTDETSSYRDGVLGGILATILRDEGIAEEYERLHPLTRLALGTSLLSTGDRERLYARLSLMRILAAYVEAMGWRPPFLPSLPWAGPFDISMSRPAEPRRTATVTRLLPPGSPTLFLGTPRAFGPPDERPSLSLRGPLPPLAPRSRVALVLAVTNLDNCLLRVTVNGRGTLVAVGEPFYPGHDPAPGRLTLALPPWWLVDGDNEILVHPARLLDHQGKPRVGVHGAWFEVEN